MSGNISGHPSEDKREFPPHEVYGTDVGRDVGIESFSPQGFTFFIVNTGLVTFELTGVFLGDSPMDINEDAKGDQVLQVEFPDDVDLGDFELIEEHKPYPEWCVPAALINERATVTLMSDED